MRCPAVAFFWSQWVTVLALLFAAHSQSVTADSGDDCVEAFPWLDPSQTEVYKPNNVSKIAEFNQCYSSSFREGQHGFWMNLNFSALFFDFEVADPYGSSVHVGFNSRNLRASLYRMSKYYMKEACMQRMECLDILHLSGFYFHPSSTFEYYVLFSGDSQIPVNETISISPVSSGDPFVNDLPWLVFFIYWFLPAICGLVVFIIAPVSILVTVAMLVLLIWKIFKSQSRPPGPVGQVPVGGEMHVTPPGGNAMTNVEIAGPPEVLCVTGRMYDDPEEVGHVDPF